MKRMLVCVLLATTMLLCTACYRPDSVSGSGFYEAYKILDADVPFADNLHTAQFDSVKKLEEDCFGRQYFLYTTFSTILWRYIDIYVICQKTDDTNAYYYQDYCYLLCEHDVPPDSDVDIAMLKERNDWDLPLNDEKMTHVAFDPYKDIVGYDDIKATIHSYLNLSEDQIVTHNGLEIKDANRQLFYVYIHNRSKAESNNNSRKHYLLVYDSRESQPIVAIQEVEPTLECQDVVSNFRTTWFDP